MICNGRRGVKFCDERGLCVSKTYFKHRSLHKYTRLARGSGRSRGKEAHISGVSEELYAALCAGCEGSTWNGFEAIHVSMLYPVRSG